MSSTTTTIITSNIQQQQKQIVLITGSNKGIGKATAKLFASKGFITYVAARNEAEGIKTKNELTVEYPNADVRFIQLEVGNTESVKAAVEKITQETHSKLDILINNAGVFMSVNQPSTYDSESLRKTFDVNFFGVVEVTQLFLPLLRNGAAKVILNISSDLGSLNLLNYTDYKFSQINSLSYNSSKTALNAFTVMLAKELAADGFKVHSVAPGFVKTPMNNFTGELEPEVAGNIIYEAAIKDNGTGRFLGSSFTTYPCAE
ncbi:hypothetical protein PPL_09431 [Heterostelium album PN500]|uniref:Uncharacterized protein n=1 Tax=Heterostelium pallidum (strain ATCC 26659 / Pp 5 / PN500) TaxID=670386 RepID=D3BPG3_HETP5|nr:hypothetical protein PPL_09431 [Heterostelium album PN500]EFA76681.1 hypothetical protein PPL_09431 [Heterostelium album PN500]|eukprot:XP_020428813.1 hypothetical protein PPL_09431 [Heterostelium album PN500]